MQPNDEKESSQSQKLPLSKPQQSQHKQQQLQITPQLLKQQTVVSFNDVNAILKEAKNINIQLDSVFEGVDSSYNKIQTIDSELQGQLQIIRMLVVQLENKKLDVQLLYDKTLQQLSESQINQQLLKVSETEEEINKRSHGVSDQSMSQTNDNTNANSSAIMRNNIISDNQQILGYSDQANIQKSDALSKNTQQQMSGLGEEEVSKIKTLCDFVDEESIELITSKAESSMQNLKQIKDDTISITESLIKQIDLHISKIHKSKTDLDYQHSQLKQKYMRLKSIQKELLQMAKTIEKVHNQIDTINLQKEQLDQLYQAISVVYKQSQLLKEEMNQIFDIVRNQSDSYDDFYEASRESYVSFVNFAPRVQQTMQEVYKINIYSLIYFFKVDHQFQQFEMARLQSLEDYEEIEKLTTWYEYFQKSYQELEVELERRQQYEQQIRQKVEMFRSYLVNEIRQEQLIRIDFNESLLYSYIIMFIIYQLQVTIDTYLEI